MGAAAVLLPGVFDRPRQSPQKMAKYINLIPGLTPREVTVAIAMVNDGWQGTWFHEHSRLAKMLHLKNLRWIRECVASVVEKLGKECVKVYGAFGRPNRYDFSEEGLFKKAYPNREWKARKPAQLSLGSQRADAPPRPEVPQGPKRNPLVAMVERAFGWEARQNSYDQIADAWSHKWRERRLRSEEKRRQADAEYLQRLQRLQAASGSSPG